MVKLNHARKVIAIVTHCEDAYLWHLNLKHRTVSTDSKLLSRYRTPSFELFLVR